jgi:hypothetical protein
VYELTSCGRFLKINPCQLPDGDEISIQKKAGHEKILIIG